MATVEYPHIALNAEKVPILAGTRIHDHREEIDRDIEERLKLSERIQKELGESTVRRKLNAS